MSGDRIIIPGETPEGPGERPRIIGRRLRPLAELQLFIGCRLLLHNPGKEQMPVLGSDGLVGIITAIKPWQLNPKRAEAIGGLNCTSPGGIFSMAAEILEKCDPYANVPGTPDCASLLEEV